MSAPVFSGVASGDRLAHLAWPAERLGEALTVLAAAGGLTTGTLPVPPAPVPEEAAARAAWIEAAAATLGLEAERL